ncbi:MAG: helix-turn-helix transcriptional regulator [Lachnospiraceae bacterium]|nr:helix-turn-helix transcriptional regulator [Lachnospiraceae bacterium]MBR2530623.1 helix-turn-helix transcriptional regulator [Lachnospiraceae bacterium]
MIVKYNFSTDENNRESIPSSRDFPFVIKYTDFSNMTGGIAGWHWHDFFELTIPLRDGMILQTPNRTIELNCGEAAFVNTSMLHTVSWTEDPQSKTCYTFFFDRSIITGQYGSIFEEKYVNPITMCRDLDCIPIRPHNKAGLRMMTLIDEMVSFFKTEEFGYEMKSRSALSELWLLLLEETKDVRKASGSMDPTDSMRMKQMMNYVHDHFRDKIYLDEIASSAGISPRECARCFKRQIGFTPMDYLNQYRVRMAAEELKTSSKSISAIGEECGFASDSYFGKIFRQYMNCSAREYRRKMLSD